MIKYISIFLELIAILLPNISYAENVNDAYRALYYLDGYKCMLADTNPKDIPNSPSPKVYETPNKNAKVIGVSDLTALVNTRVPQINGRQAILQSNGSTVWIDAKNLYSYSKPCYAVLLANGRHGFGPTPPKHKSK